MMIACDCDIVCVMLAGGRYCESLNGGTVELLYTDIL